MRVYELTKQFEIRKPGVLDAFLCGGVTGFALASWKGLVVGLAAATFLLLTKLRRKRPAPNEA